MAFFNMETAPPTDDDIEKERQTIERKKTNMYMKKALMMISLLLIETIDLTYKNYFMAAIVLAPILYVIIDFIHDNKQLRGNQSMLDPIKKEDCPDMLALCHKYERIKLYQNAVINMGRSLTQGEYEAATKAITKWEKEERIRESTDRQERACATLSHEV
jgi:hypothetical protein